MHVFRNNWYKVQHDFNFDYNLEMDRKHLFLDDDIVTKILVEG